MTPAEFLRRWASSLPEGDRPAFLVEFSAVVRYEQDRERRRLCTDQALYRRSVEQTMAELRALAGVKA